jgi:hypothetical protein
MTVTVCRGELGMTGDLFDDEGIVTDRFRHHRRKGMPVIPFTE